MEYLANGDSDTMTEFDELIAAQAVSADFEPEDYANKLGDMEAAVATLSRSADAPQEALDALLKAAQLIAAFYDLCMLDAT